MEDEPEEFESRPATDLTDPRTTNRVPVVREEIIPFDGTEMQTDPSPYKRMTPL
jgi:hypothetical protein